MTRNEFIETVKNNILGYMPLSYSDRRVQVHEVTKDGDITLCGLALSKADKRAAPLIYLDSYYDRCLNGWAEDLVIKMIADDYIKAERVAAIDIPDMSYENIKDDLRIKILYNRTNAGLLRDLVSTDLGCGYSAAVYIDLSDKIKDGAVVNVRYSMVEALGYDIDRLFEDALNGSIENRPAHLSYILDVLTGEKAEDLFEEGQTFDREKGLLVLTTEDRMCGAAALYYPGIQEAIAQFVGEDYYVIPSSVHEVLIYPADGEMRAEELAGMVKMVNQAEVLPEEQLGNRVLYYDAESKDLSVAFDLDLDRDREEAR